MLASIQNALPAVAAAPAPAVARGSRCSVSGRRYETHVWNIVQRCADVSGWVPLAGDGARLGGGSSHAHDLQIAWRGQRVPIELKRSFKVPDWGQAILERRDDGRWAVKKDNPVIQSALDVWQQDAGEDVLWDGRTPSFLDNDITHATWLNEKHAFKDAYLDVDSKAIADYYADKGVAYIQVGRGAGLYHTGEDVCGFGVPEFVCEQRIRIRIKVHTRKNKAGHCRLSVTAALQPARLLPDSPYSLDSTATLPPLVGILGGTQWGNPGSPSNPLLSL